jgi:hypothetical protein
MASEVRARRLTGVILAMACAVASCGRVESPVAVGWSLEPAPPASGQDTVALVTLTDAEGRPVAGARLRIEGHMSHPGMAPITTRLTESADGTYEGRVRFSMAGDWILVVTGELADGTRIDRQLEVTGVRPAG